MNKTIWIVVIAVVVILGIFLYSGSNTGTAPTDSDQDSGLSGEGTVIFSFTDATADINNVNEIVMKVDGVELYSQSQGWVRVSSDDVEYKLLDLKKRSESRVYATVKAAARTYSQVKVTLKEVVVETKAGAKKTAQMPRKELELTTTVQVKKDKTTSVNVDVLADQSLHQTEKGDYVFAPVVKVESRSEANVTTSAGGVVEISGGNVDSNVTFGMDLSGVMKTDFRLDGKIKLDVSGDGIKVLGGSSMDTKAGDILEGDVKGAVEGTIR